MNSLFYGFLKICFLEFWHNPNLLTFNWNTYHLKHISGYIICIHVYITCSSILILYTWFNLSINWLIFLIIYVIVLCISLSPWLKKGCKMHEVYGINCDMFCPNNCRYNTCNIQNGDCFKCKPGWTGTVCDMG